MPATNDIAANLGERLRADGLFHDAEVIKYPDESHLLAILVPQGYRPAPALRQHVLDMANMPGCEVSVALLPLIPRRADGGLDLEATLAKVGRAATVSTLVDPSTEGERLLVDLVSAISPGLRISVSDSLGDLGVDSLGVFELAALIAERTGVSLSLESIYAADSLRTLAAHIQAGG
jgi:mycobactin peptide synthetase MbtF